MFNPPKLSRLREMGRETTRLLTGAVPIGGGGVGVGGRVGTGGDGMCKSRF